MTNKDRKFLKTFLPIFKKLSANGRTYSDFIAVRNGYTEYTDGFFIVRFANTFGLADGFYSVDDIKIVTTGGETKPRTDIRWPNTTDSLFSDFKRCPQSEWKINPVYMEVIGKIFKSYGEKSALVLKNKDSLLQIYSDDICILTAEPSE